jgi:hypothetical protein
MTIRYLAHHRAHLHRKRYWKLQVSVFLDSMAKSPILAGVSICGVATEYKHLHVCLLNCVAGIGHASKLSSARGIEK